MLNVKIPKPHKKRDDLHVLSLLKEIKGNRKTCLRDPCNQRSYPGDNISGNHEYFDFHIFLGECKYICAVVTIYSPYVSNDIQLY